MPYKYITPYKIVVRNKNFLENNNLKLGFDDTIIFFKFTFLYSIYYILGIN